MQYVVIQTKDKNETDFFIDLFKKMNKRASKLSDAQIEELALLQVMKRAEKSGKGKLENVMTHLDKVIARKLMSPFRSTLKGT